jgi:2'-5' RNA ligase
METKRLFIAIPLPEVMKETLVRYLEPYKKIPARWVEAKNYHITCLFLGDIEVERIDALKERLQQACRRCLPFTLAFDRVCFFPDMRRPHMIWASFEKHAAFSELLLSLVVACEKENDKEALPHVTLARLAHYHLRESIPFPPLALPPLEVSECELIASTLTDKSPIYTLLGHFPLGQKFALFDHIADVGVRARGSNPEELFESALSGMVSLLFSSPLSFTIEQKIELRATDLNALLIDFLSQILTACHIQKAVFCGVKFHKFSDTELVATIFGAPVDHFDRDVKAVTYHEARVEKTETGTYEARIIFDI